LAVLTAVSAAGGAENPPVEPFETRASLSGQGKIDGLVFGVLRQMRIQPANVCSDGVFVRRVYLDVIGTLPTAEEARQFLTDRSPHKRRALIQQLLERDEFADYWALKWGDLLRVKAEFPINLWPNAVQAYHHWIRAAIRDNMPYDQFARELITASGSNFRVPQVNFYRSLQSKEPRAMAQAVALNFMGARAEQWPEDRLTKMEVFFSKVGFKSTAEWKEEIVFFDSEKAAAEGPKTAVFPDGTTVELSPDADPRDVFADWLITPQNPWFARNIVNHVWYWLLGYGIINEPDDIRPTNPASNPKLLTLLERELVSSRYDLKEIFQQILNSKAYQFSSIPADDNPAAGDHFAHYRLRRLEAEVLIDALCQITGSTEEYSSAIPEPFTFIPEHQRSIALADGSITSTFLEMFGRPPRDTGMESERNNRSSAAQRLHLLNSGHVLRKIEQSQKLRKLITTGDDPREKAMMIYLTILSRLPTEKELKIMAEYTSSSEVQGSEALVDVVWALINTTEFYYRH
jgi:hypothetical protein